MWMTLAYIGLVLIELAVIARAILRPHRDPASRIAWVVVIAVVPVMGILLYLLFGETSALKDAPTVQRLVTQKLMKL